MILKGESMSLRMRVHDREPIGAALRRFKKLLERSGVTKELRKRSPDLKIIFVSGYAEEAFAKSLPEGGQFEFLAKPFTLKQLIAKVKEVSGI